VEQNILDDLGFSLDLIYLASAIGGQETCSARSASPELEEMEKMLQAVLNSSGAD